MLKRSHMRKFSVLSTTKAKKRGLATYGQVQFLLCVEGWRGWLASGGHLVEVLLAVDLLLSLVQKLQHFLDDSLKRTA